MRLILIRCVSVLLICSLLTGSAFAQQVADLFATDRYLAIYLNLNKPYEAAIKILKTINDPANAGFKKTMQELYDTAFKNFFNARTTARSRGCSANMRVLLGATEMYNMDNQVPMSDQIDIKTLVEESYLRSVPLCPDGGTYSARGDMSADGEVACSVHNTVGELNQGSIAEAIDITFEDLLLKLLDFHDKGLLRPTGGLYVAIDPTQGAGFLIETTGKPQELVSFFKEMKIPVPEPESSSAEKVVFDFPMPYAGVTSKLNVTSRGIYMNAFAAKTTNNVAHWGTFQQSAQKADNHIVIELLPEYVHDRLPFLRGETAPSCLSNMRVLLGAVEMYNMDNSELMHEVDVDELFAQQYVRAVPECPNGGEYSQTGDLAEDGQIKCSVHNTVDDPITVPAPPAAENPQQQMIKSIKALRLILGEQSCVLVAGVPDKTSREGIKGLLSMFVAQFMPMIEQGMDERRKELAEQMNEEQGKLFENLKAMLKSLKVMEKGTWVGFQADGLPGAQMIVPVAGILAAIAVPNFQRARNTAREKACFATQRVMAGAIEMYNMDNPKMMGVLDIQALISGGYLRSEPSCADGGVLGATPDEDGHLIPHCSIHGRVR